MRTRLTQYEAIFYRLYTKNREARHIGKELPALIPVHELMGEVYCEENGKLGFVSYEVGARISEVYGDNPGLLYREMITGRSGAKYYGYRIAEGATRDNIIDPKLRALYDLCRRHWLGVSTREKLEGDRATLPTT